jgi:hypothetical protein
LVLFSSFIEPPEIRAENLSGCFTEAVEPLPTHRAAELGIGSRSMIITGSIALLKLRKKSEPFHPGFADWFVGTKPKKFSAQSSLNADNM